LLACLLDELNGDHFALISLVPTMVLTKYVLSCFIQ